MILIMPNVAVDQLKLGAILNSDVKDLSGRLLLKTGTAIDEKHLKIFRSWGIVEVDVDEDLPGDEQTDTSLWKGLDEEGQAMVEQESARHFVHADRDHPVFVELMTLARERLVTRFRHRKDG